MTRSEKIAVEAIRAQAFALAAQAEALLGEPEAKRCCDDPRIVDESTYSETIRRCANCGTEVPKPKEEESHGVD